MAARVDQRGDGQSAIAEDAFLLGLGDAVTLDQGVPEGRHILVRAIGFLSDGVDADVETVPGREQALDAALDRRPFQPLIAGKDVDAAMLGDGPGLPIGQGTRREREDVIGLKARLEKGLEGVFSAVKTVLTAGKVVMIARPKRDFSDSRAQGEIGSCNLLLTTIVEAMDCRGVAILCVQIDPAVTFPAGSGVLVGTRALAIARVFISPVYRPPPRPRPPAENRLAHQG